MVWHVKVVFEIKERHFEKIVYLVGRKVFTFAEPIKINVQELHRFSDVHKNKLLEKATFKSSNNI